MTGAVQGVSGNEMFLARFYYRCKKDLKSNKLTIVILEKILVDEEPEAPTIIEIPEEQVTSEKV